MLRYPRCLHAGCVGDDVPREIDFSYVRGFLSSVSDYAPSLSYQLGGMLHQVEHANGVMDTIATKPGLPMQRPHQITTSGVAGGANWSSGTYTYDGAGNVKRIGDQRYQYDRMSRLVEGEVLAGAQEKTQSVGYDAFGNILSLTTDGSFRATSTSNATNRLTGADYDAGGNLTDVRGTTRADENVEGGGGPKSTISGLTTSAGANSGRNRRVWRRSGRGKCEVLT